MKRTLAVLLSYLLALAPLAVGQQNQTIVAMRHRTTASGPNTWTLVRYTPVTGACSNSDNCSATLSVIGSGNLMVMVQEGGGGAAFITGSSFNSIGGSWVHPGGNSAGPCNVQNNNAIDCAYVLHTSPCSSSCTVTWQTNGYFFGDAEVFYEYTPSTGSANYDTANTTNGGSTFTTTPPVTALTLSGTSDLVIQTAALVDNTCSAVGSPYTSVAYFVATAWLHTAFAAGINLSSVTASPTWTCGNTRYLTMAVAFK